MSPQRIYPNLRRFFRETGMTQSELAERLGITQPKLSRIVNRKNEPDLELAMRISRVCRVPLESMIRREKALISATVASDNE
jgi:transcriptional regulator with XRE-family HTH domain